MFLRKKSTDIEDRRTSAIEKTFAATNDPGRLQLLAQFHERCIFAAKLWRLVSRDKMYTGEIALRIDSIA